MQSVSKFSGARGNPDERRIASKGRRRTPVPGSQVNGGRPLRSDRITNKNRKWLFLFQSFICRCGAFVHSFVVGRCIDAALQGRQGSREDEVLLCVRRLQRDRLPRIRCDVAKERGVDPRTDVIPLPLLVRCALLRATCGFVHPFIRQTDRRTDGQNDGCAECKRV